MNLQEALNAYAASHPGADSCVLESTVTILNEIANLSENTRKLVLAALAKTDSTCDLSDVSGCLDTIAYNNKTTAIMADILAKTTKDSELQDVSNCLSIFDDEDEDDALAIAKEVLGQADDLVEVEAHQDGCKCDDCVDEDES